MKITKAYFESAWKKSITFLQTDLPIVYESSFIWVKQSTRRDALTLLRGYVALIPVQTPLPYVPDLTDGLSTQTSGVWVNLVRQF